MNQFSSVLPDVRQRYQHPATVRVVLELSEQRGGSDFQLLGGKGAVAVIPLERREDIVALNSRNGRTCSDAMESDWWWGTSSGSSVISTRSPVARAQARSVAFCSSRMLPGQSKLTIQQQSTNGHVSSAVKR